MFSDFYFILYWWALIMGLGIIFLPLTYLFFNKFWDKGYIFSKLIGILLVSYTIWILGSLKILPFTAQALWLVILAGVIGNIYLVKKSLVTGAELHKNWRIFIFEEILFFLALVLWSYVRGFQPDIQGLEKFMDYGFVNAILRSRFFPPADMWLAGESINYYYFGHLISAVLTKLSGIDSAITYNLMLGSLFAFTFTTAFSFSTNLLRNTKYEIRNTKLIVLGLLTACLVSLGGNLHSLWWFLKNGNFRSYWYPDATRFIVQLFGAADNTIHEFPIYSFVVADLHGHLLNLPFVIMFLSLVLTFYLHKKIYLPTYIFCSLMLGLFYITNTWDLPIYGLILGFTILLFNYLKYKINLKTLIQTALHGLGIIFVALIATLPFHLNFQNIAKGVALADFHSPLWMLLVLWGFPLFNTICFLVYFVKQKKNIKSNLNINYFILIIYLVSWFLIIFPEVFYIKDIYIHSYQRANTMFKLTYQSFVMFYLTAFYITVSVIRNLKSTIFRFLFITFNLIFLIFIMIVYPNFAVKSYYGLRDYKGLYGLKFLERSYSDDYQAVLWLKKNVPDQPVILEAVGESYTDFARVSANTGLPTVLGWRVHEWLWRGSFDEAGKRTTEVQDMYESPDIPKTKGLLSKYQVKYIFIGDLERKTYPKLDEKKFENLGEVVFISNQTKIFKLKGAD
jgi:uncharacterized membrane protein